MDLPAILERAPELCLIDELAHTNAPGVEHKKRYQDVDDVLDAGIDVLSTLNVQHLDLLNDRIAELTGIRVRETIPDDVLGRADEVVMIDSLRRRCSSGCAPARFTRRSGSDRRSTTSSKSRTSPPCARSRYVRSPRRSGTSGSRPSTSARARRVSRRRPPRRWASGCWRWSSPIRARSGWSVARGAPRSDSAPTSTCCGCARLANGLSEDQERSLVALRQLASVLGRPPARRGVGQRAGRGGGRGEKATQTYILMGASRPARGWRGCGRRCRSN